MARRYRLLLIAAAIVAFGVWRFGWWWVPHYEPTGSQLPDVAFRTMGEHDEVMRGRDWPYVLEIEGPRGAILYFGTRHTDDPSDPQISAIRERWSAFRPTRAATENRLGPFLGTQAMGVRHFGEFALAAALAAADGIPVCSLEPSWEAEVAEMKAAFPVEEVTLFYTLRVYLSERGDREGAALDELAAHLLRKRGNRPGLTGSLPDLDRLDALWKERFGALGDWRTLPPEAVHPSPSPTRLQALATRANEVRDRHAVRVLLELAGSGERVFAIAGGSHVVKQEPVLRAALAQR